MSEFLNYIWIAIRGTFEYFTFKSFCSILIAIAAYLVGPEHFQLINALMLLVVFDFITGISSAKTKGDEITSRGALRSAIKVVVYSLLVSASHLAETVLPGDTFFEHVTVSFLVITEFISILENIGKMGYAVPMKLLNKLEELRDAR